MASSIPSEVHAQALEERVSMVGWWCLGRPNRCGLQQTTMSNISSQLKFQPGEESRKKCLPPPEHSPSAAFLLHCPKTEEKKL